MVELKWLVTEKKMLHFRYITHGEVLLTPICEKVPEWIGVIDELYQKKISLEDFDEVIRVIRITLKGPDWSQKERKLESPMYLAVSNGYLKFLKIVLSTSMDFGVCCFNM